MGRPKNDDLKKLNIERENLANIYADKVINEHKTIRQIAEECHTSKSTVHKYLKDYINSKSVKNKVEKTLNNNFAIKHIHGGEATKQKKLKEREEKEKTSNK